MIKTVVFLLLGFLSVRDVPTGATWQASGQVASSFQVPSSGGAWAIAIKAMNDDGHEYYLDLWCDREQDEIVEACSRLEIGQDVHVGGLIISNEPSSGQRLGIRALCPLALDLSSYSCITGTDPGSPAIGLAAAYDIPLTAPARLGGK